MTDEIFEQAAAIKKELQQIEALLTAQPFRKPFELAADFPEDLDTIVVLAQPLLDAANEQWDDILMARKTVLLAAFADLDSSSS